MSSATSTDPGLRPWQLFLLAGMLAATAVVMVSKGQAMSSVVVLSLTVVSSSLVAMAGYRSLAPLFSAPADTDEVPVIGRARAALEREKALVLRTIKEIEFDHAMGKTAPADFEDMRDRLRVRAAGLLRRLEGSDFRTAVERDLAARATSAGQAPAVVAPPPLAEAPAPPSPATPAPQAPPEAPAPRVPGAVVAPSTLARLCGGCGGVNDVDARFCKHCGSALVGAAS
ncbi:MAG: zinc ribbon domain-containing protein [Vicinamibacterales bacterium]